MAYCTQSDIEKQLPESTLVDLTDDNAYGVVDADIVDRAIADADEEIDAFLSIRYSLPFSSTPALVRLMSVDFAVCNLYARRDHVDMPAVRKDRCARHRERLERIANGELALDVPDQSSDADGGIETTSDKDDRIFSIGRDSDSSVGTLDNY